MGVTDTEVHPLDALPWHNCTNSEHHLKYELCDFWAAKFLNIAGVLFMKHVSGSN